MKNNFTLGNIVIGGVSASVVLWLLMKYNMRYAWLYLAIIILGLLLVYKDAFFGQLNQTIAFLKGI